MKTCEILAPAGDEQSAYAALNSGADAVYLGLSQFSARANAENFDVSALEKLCVFAHLLGAKVYVTANTLIKDGETDAFFALVLAAWNAGADAVLMQDMFLGGEIRRAYPDIVLHLSTQAGCNNEDGARLAKEYGFSRVVLARETPLSEIAKISKIIETEVFVQGALCTCFSGQCYLSSFAGNNSGNRGRCKQPCRKKYRIDRKGFEEEAYALSPSDLSVGERTEELLRAGVYSLKIEGRMRRPEYVAAAVSYYRAIADGKDASEAFTRLRRAYNRGDYTAGLSFGQDKNFLSRDVQGHIGEDVGEISLRGGKFYCRSVYPAVRGDCFKILRDGKEVCGATFLSGDGRGFYLSAPARLNAGDRVRVTTDTASNAALLSVKRTRSFPLSLYFCAGEVPRAVCGELEICGDMPLERAERSPLTEKDLTECFLKTDGLPLTPAFGEVIAENVFLPRSLLNAFRRECYARICAYLAPPRAPLSAKQLPAPLIVRAEGTMTAVIASDLRGLEADVLIYKPADYSDLAGMSEGKGEKYLYLPPFFTSEDEALVADMLPLFDGVYCEGIYGIAFAERHRKPLFAGTGFNLTNRFAVNGVLRAGAKYFALSKELTGSEQRTLAAEGAFALTAGAVKVMDLVHCPFGRRCGDCDRKSLYRLTDEEGREFPLRRYRFSGGFCRFEVYNCASLAYDNGATSALVDLSAEEAGQALVAAARDPDRAKRLQKNSTSGHGNRSLL